MDLIRTSLVEKQSVIEKHCGDANSINYKHIVERGEVNILQIAIAKSEL